MGGTELELPSKTSGKSHIGASGGAESGAVGARDAATGLDLQDRLTAAEWRAGRLRAALAEVADLAKGKARVRALAALAADRVAFPAPAEGGGE